MENKLFYMHGSVNVKKALEAFNYIAGNNFTIEELNKSSLHGVLYLDVKGVPLKYDRKKSEQLSSYKVIPTCVYSKINGRQICASFMRDGFKWKGVYVGTLDSIIEKLQRFYKNGGGNLSIEDTNAIKEYSEPLILKGDNVTDIKLNSKKYCIENYENILKEDIVNTGKNIEKTVATSREIEIYNDIYDRLLIKENWKSSKKPRLEKYIRALLEKVQYEQEKCNNICGNGYTLSEDGQKALINTGLIDIYNNTIYIIDLSNREKVVDNKKLTLYTSKSHLVGLGFSKDSISKLPRAIKFYEDKSDLIFSADIEDFDLEATMRLHHIIQERRERFPEAYRDISADIICDKIKVAVSKAVKMSEVDCRYIVPMYNIKENTIQYLMPLHLDKSLDETPELVVVIGKYNGFYNIYTILNTDDAYDNARLLCRPDHSWLRVS